VDRRAAATITFGDLRNLGFAIRRDSTVPSYSMSNRQAEFATNPIVRIVVILARFRTGVRKVGRVIRDAVDARVCR
jgi:hypothetical protein